MILLGAAMPGLTELTARLTSRQDLSAAEVSAAVTALGATLETDESKGAFLTALAAKGETPGELAAFAR